MLRVRGLLISSWKTWTILNADPCFKTHSMMTCELLPPSTMKQSSTPNGLAKLMQSLRGSSGKGRTKHLRHQMRLSTNHSLATMSDLQRVPGLRRKSPKVRLQATFVGQQSLHCHPMWGIAQLRLRPLDHQCQTLNQEREAKRRLGMGAKLWSQWRKLVLPLQTTTNSWIGWGEDGSTTPIVLVSDPCDPIALYSLVIMPI